MATINNINRVKFLYNQGLSAREIAVKIDCNIGAVYYCLRRNKIMRRSARENNFIKFKNKKPSFSIKKRLTIADERLKNAGIMLYWGEGSKWKGETIVDFANSDPSMIKIFMAFLRKICGINESKLRAYLYCYQNQKVSNLIDFWSKLTGIDKNRFTKPYIKNDYHLVKSGKMKYGLIHIRYCDKKLLELIKEWINEFADKY